MPKNPPLPPKPFSRSRYLRSPPAPATMSKPASCNDDTTDSEDGVCTSPNSSLLSDELGHGGSAPTPIRGVIAKAGEDDTTKRAVSDNGVCSSAVAAVLPDELELGHGGSAPILFNAPDFDAVTEAGDVENDLYSEVASVLAARFSTASEPDELGLVQEPVGSSSTSFNVRDFEIPGCSSWFHRAFNFMLQQPSVDKEEDVEVPLVGDKEPISALEIQFQSAEPILLEKIKLLDEQYSALRRTRGDGNCFYRSFMFSYMEHILETQDRAEVERITASIKQCKKTFQSLGYDDLTYEDLFDDFIKQLESVLHGQETSISHEMLLGISCDAHESDTAVKFFRFVTSGEILRRKEFFKPFIAGLAKTTVDEFCKQSVETMGEESDHVHLIALSDALGVPIRVVYLDQSTNNMGAPALNFHDFNPVRRDTTENTTSVVSDAPKAYEISDQDGATENAASSASDAPKAFETISQKGTTKNTASVASDAVETSGQDGTNESTTYVARYAPKPFVTLLYRPGHYDILYSK